MTYTMILKMSWFEVCFFTGLLVILIKQFRCTGGNCGQHTVHLMRLPVFLFQLEHLQGIVYVPSPGKFSYDFKDSVAQV